jgi:hypothetical protein
LSPDTTPSSNLVSRKAPAKPVTAPIAANNNPCPMRLLNSLAGSAPNRRPSAIKDVWASIYQRVSGQEPEKNTTVTEPNSHRAFSAACFTRPNRHRPSGGFSGPIPTRFRNNANGSVICRVMWLHRRVFLGLPACGANLTSALARDLVLSKFVWVLSTLKIGFPKILELVFL